MHTDMQQTGCIHYYDWDNSYIPHILHEIYMQRMYKPYLENRKDLVMFDLGTHIGLWSIYASKYAKKVYAFEPTQQSYDLAIQNFKDNNITNVEIHQKAISDKDGKAKFYLCPNATMNSLNEQINDQNVGTKEVETIRLDTFVKEQKIEHIDFMKIDIEGVEHKMFTSESFKNIAPIVDAFVYEWHIWSGVNPHIINSGLRDLGYTIKQLNSEPFIYAGVRL